MQVHECYIRITSLVPDLSTMLKINSQAGLEKLFNCDEAAQMFSESQVKAVASSCYDCGMELWDTVPNFISNTLANTIPNILSVKSP
jgi:hypothetical protein